MSNIKDEYFANRAVKFASNKLLFLIMTTLLLVLVDGGIVNSANAACSSMDCVTGTPRTQPQPTKAQAISNATGTIETTTGSVATAINNNLIYFIVSLVVQTEYSSNGNANLTQKQIKELYNVGISPQQMYALTVTAGFADSSSFYAASCSVFWCEFAQAPPSQPTQTSVEQDILSTGNSPSQVSIPMEACNFLVNSQNVCNETNVTAATAIISVAVLGGIIAAVTTAVNNQANSNEQRQKDNNLLLTLLAIQNKNTGAQVQVCYDSATPPNVIPCP